MQGGGREINNLLLGFAVRPEGHPARQVDLLPQHLTRYLAEAAHGGLLLFP
jgi:hypothetical protein